MSKEKKMTEIERVKEYQGPRNINEAIHEVYCNIGYVQKTGKVEFGSTRYKFAGEADFIAALRPEMVAAGIYQYPHAMKMFRNERIEIEKEYGGKITKTFQHRVIIHVTYRFQHSDSDTFIDVEAIGEAMDTGDKAMNKAMTAANKYALRQAFMIETGDDPDKYASKEEGGVHEEVDTKKKSPFKNASLRREFFDNVVGSFEVAKTEDELKELVSLNKKRLAEMDDGTEHDKLFVEEIRKRYKVCQGRFKDNKEGVENGRVH